jgi:hypothetical protein
MSPHSRCQRKTSLFKKIKITPYYAITDLTSRALLEFPNSSTREFKGSARCS